MSKNELRVIARIVLIGVGLYVLLQTLINVLSGILTILIVGSAVKEKSMMITAFVINIVLALLAAFFLARYATRFSAKIIESEPVDDTQISSLAVTFRLVCIVAGLLYLYWTIFGSISTIVWYISAKLSHAMVSTLAQLWSEVIKCVIQIGLGIYLVLGAPRFVRWQVKKTISQCNKTIEQQPTWR
jgi:hypothetical protein